jgi:hypothetical protein
MIDRQFNTALFILRALQVGLQLADLDVLETGEVMDIITERANDDAKYNQVASQADFDRF